MGVAEAGVVDVYPRRTSGRLTPPPDYEQLYEAMQMETMSDVAEERVRKKYACQGIVPERWNLLVQA
jgi:hypothetical protein